MNLIRTLQTFQTFSLPLGILAQAGNAILPEEYKPNRKQLEECNFEKEEQYVMLYFHSNLIHNKFYLLFSLQVRNGCLCSTI